MYFEELRIGMTVETDPVVIDKGKMLAFAQDYDPIPLHTDEEYAKHTPFGRLIAPGVMSFVVEKGTVRVVNSAIYALQRFQKQMQGAAEEAGLMTDEDIAAWITASRREEEAE